MVGEMGAAAGAYLVTPFRQPFKQTTQNARTIQSA
jgi:hypothetical protein